MVVIPEMLPCGVPADGNWHIIIMPNFNNKATQPKSIGIRFQRGVSISDQPGKDCTIYILVLSSQAGRLRERVAGPRDCCEDGPSGNEFFSVR